MIIRFWKWLTELPVCKECELLKIQLEQERYERRQLFNNLVAITQPKQEVNFNEPVIHEPLNKILPWHIRKEMLETEDRERAKLQKKQEVKPSNEELEKEVLDLAEQVNA